MNVFEGFRRKLNRAPVNPMDKSTVVSILPKKIDEIKYTIQPGRFILAPGSYEKPSILVVGPSSWWREIDQEQPMLELTNSSIQVADSIVTDYCNGLLGCDMDGSMPGLFYIPGSHDVADIKKNFTKELDKAKEKQRNWYQAIIAETDKNWISSKHHPLAVSSDSKLAARELGIDKDWMRDFTTYNMVKCVACGAMRDPAFPICQSCHAVIDSARAKELNLTFAQ